MRLGRGERNEKTETEGGRERGEEEGEHASHLSFYFVLVRRLFQACLLQGSLLVALIINTDGFKNQHRVHYIVLGFFFTDQSDHSFSDFKTDCFFVFLGTWQLWGGNEVQMGKGQELQLSEMRWRQGRGNMLDRKGNKKSVTSCYPHFFIPHYHLRYNFLSNRQKQDLWG